MMTATLKDVGSSKKTSAPPSEESAAVELVKLAKEQSLSLTGPCGAAEAVHKNVIETALNEEMTHCVNRPLDGVYAAIFIAALIVTIRDGQLANQLACAAIGVALAGEKGLFHLKWSMVA